MSGRAQESLDTEPIPGIELVVIRAWSSLCAKFRAEIRELLGCRASMLVRRASGDVSSGSHFRRIPRLFDTPRNRDPFSGFPFPKPNREPVTGEPVPTTTVNVLFRGPPALWRFPDLSGTRGVFPVSGERKLPPLLEI